MTSEERTERPTPRRLERARREGDVARSAIAGAIASIVLLPVGAVLTWAALGAWPDVFRLAAQAAAAHEFGARAFGRAAALITTVAMAGFALSAASSFVATASCGIPLPSLARLRPKFERLAPTRAAARLCSREQIAAAGLSAFAALLVAVASTAAAVCAIARHDAGAARPPLAAGGCALAAVAALDVWRVRRQTVRALMMTKHEVRDERWELEGRPEVKSWRVAVARRNARSVRLAAVRRATVVITNPTHVAVALRYAPPAVDVPIVVARGVGFAADAIRGLATMIGVPIVERPDLARALYASVQIDGPIPESAFAVVAHIFARLIRDHGRLRGDEDAV